MRIARFRTKNGRVEYGIIEGEIVTLIKGNILGEWSEGDSRFPVNEVLSREKSRMLIETIPIIVKPIPAIITKEGFSFK